MQLLKAITFYILQSKKLSADFFWFQFFFPFIQFLPVFHYFSELPFFVSVFVLCYMLHSLII